MIPLVWHASFVVDGACQLSEVLPNIFGVFGVFDMRCVFYYKDASLDARMCVLIYKFIQQCIVWQYRCEVYQVFQKKEMITIY